MRSVYDRHVCGLFDRATWLRLLRDVGFHRVAVLPLEHSHVPLGSVEVFVALRRARKNLEAESPAGGSAAGC